MLTADYTAKRYGVKTGMALWQAKQVCPDITFLLYGNYVQVSHGTADDGHRYDSLYAHMSSIAVAQGAAVQKGDLLGYVGNTGNVYGAGGGYHLHLELRVDGSRVDPLGFVPTH